jgi:hypothetical protein
MRVTAFDGASAGPPRATAAGSTRRRIAALAGVLVLVLVAACGSGTRRIAARSPVLRPLPPAPPGSVVVFGPLTVVAVDAVSSSIGWDREPVSATRTVGYDVTLEQERWICPATARGDVTRDGQSCEGAPKAGPQCRAESPVRARASVTVEWALDVAERCAGDREAYAVGASADARSALDAAGVGCFKARNKFKPESAWTSIYALTELAFDERVRAVESDLPSVLANLLSATPAVAFCRDDGAYLDGTVGRATPLAAVTLDRTALAPLLLARAPLGGETPLPNGRAAFVSEHAAWEACNGPASKGSVVAQERCQLVREIDRMLRDVEETARPETPRGPAPAASGATP